MKNTVPIPPSETIVHDSPDDWPNHSFRKIAFWSLLPAIILVPAWVGFGRIFFGAFGWAGYVTGPFALIVLFPYHFVLVLLALAGKTVYLSLRTTRLLLVYYAALLINQLTMIDFAGSHDWNGVPAFQGSVLTQRGVPEVVNNAFFGVSTAVGFILIAMLVVVLVIDAVENRRKKLVAQQA